MQKKIIDVLTVSGGKDSTAMWLKGLEEGIKVTAVFSDTGHEHALTYKYMEYLEKQLGPVRHIKADFTKQIERKRLYVQEHWPRKLTMDVNGHWYTDVEEPENDAPDWEPQIKEQTGITWNEWSWQPAQPGMTDREAAEVVKRALTVLYPTGNPFLDLCIWKGRFPSTKRRFCTTELKAIPTWKQVYFPLLETGHRVISWQGVRAQESAARAKLTEREDTPEGYEIYRPILNWNVDQVFEQHRKHGIEPNPLYKLGMGRVGCMPCINTRKIELFEIARRFPKEIARVEEWERIVKLASKRQASTFFPTANGRGTNGINDEVEWSKTSFGGKNFDLLKAIELADEPPMCSSQYGLCE